MTLKYPVQATLFVGWFLLAPLTWATNYSYDGRVTSDVKRDRIMAIAEDHNTLVWYSSPASIAHDTVSGATFPAVFRTLGWKVGIKYCWGGEDTSLQYLKRVHEDDDCAGNSWTWSGSSYDAYCAGSDCSGFVSNAWTAPRNSTAGFPSISDDIEWDNLRMGDALNYAGSHIRLFDYFTTNTHTSMLYEQTSGSGLIWQMVHRSLGRNDDYQPIRYNDPGDYKVYDFPEPVILYIVRTGIERVEIRWDGQGDEGFNLYQSLDGAAWTQIRSASPVLTPVDRTCEVSGLLPDHSYYFKMTGQNTGGETIDSDVAAYRLDSGTQHQVLLVDGSDRYREQYSSNHTWMIQFGQALASQGIGFDFCSNEVIVDKQIDLSDYDAVVWMLGEESTFDETFSWAEQMHLMAFLEGGGSLFVSGSEIGWDLDYRANWDNYKNGSINDATFYNRYLSTDYVDDDAGTYHIQGVAGTLFEGLDCYFDDGTQGTYDVVYPDMLSATDGATVGITYQGGLGGNACVYHSSATGTVVYLGFPFETIYPESARNRVMKSTLNYFDLSLQAPTIKTATQSAADTVRIAWEGHASEGFRLYRKTEEGSWLQIQNEATLTSEVRSATVGGLAVNTRYAFKLQAVNSSGAGPDSDVLVCALESSGSKILVVDGYDRWNSQNSGSNHAWMEFYAQALSDRNSRYDSCTNESILEGRISLDDYDILVWMCGEESTESETLSEAEQLALEDFLKGEGYLFISGSEIGWDLVHKADALNDFSNGSANDEPFYNSFLKAIYESDSSGTGAVTGVSGTVFEATSFNFDFDGTHGTYSASYPDVLSATGGSTPLLYYGAGPNVAAVGFTGVFPGGTGDGCLIYFGFPFETIYNASDRSGVMEKVLSYFQLSEVKGWKSY